jgi:tyrosine-protein kinase
VELRQYIQIVIKWLWLIVLGTSLAAGVAYGVSSCLPPVYSASVSLLIRSARQGGDDYGTIYVNQYLAATYSELMTKRPIIERAVLDLGLDPAEMNKLMNRIEVWVVPNTSVIRLTIEDSDPRLAMDLANRIVAVFIEAQRDPRERREQDILVVEPATLPIDPVAPRVLFNTAIATAGGAILAVGVAFLSEYLDDTLSAQKDIDHTLSLPVLAVIPRLWPLQERDRTPITLTAPMSPVSEAYYTLYTRIQASHDDTRTVSRTILVTSPVSWKEKDRVVADLGVAMAQSGLKILLVDADLRHSQLHQVFELPNERGLSTLLAGDTDIESCIASTDTPNLSVLCSGPLSVGPSAPLGSQQVTWLVEELAKHGDMILFDAPPVLATNHTLALASRVDGTVLAVKSHSTRQEAAVQALDRLRDVRTHVLGVALIKVQNRWFRYQRNGQKR